MDRQTVYPSYRNKHSLATFSPLIKRASASLRTSVLLLTILACSGCSLSGSNGAPQGPASLQVSSSATFNCGSGGTVQAKGSFTGKVTVIATPASGASSGSGAGADGLTFSFIPDLSLLKAPAANIQCVAGDLNDVAWAGVATVLGAKFTLSSSMLTYSYAPPKATGAITFSLHPVKP